MAIKTLRPFCIQFLIRQWTVACRMTRILDSKLIISLENHPMMTGTNPYIMSGTVQPLVLHPGLKKKRYSQLSNWANWEAIGRHSPPTAPSNDCTKSGCRAEQSPDFEQSHRTIDPRAPD